MRLGGSAKIVRARRHFRFCIKRTCLAALAMSAIGDRRKRDRLSGG